MRKVDLRETLMQMAGDKTYAPNLYFEEAGTYYRVTGINLYTYGVEFLDPQDNKIYSVSFSSVKDHLYEKEE